MNTIEVDKYRFLEVSTDPNIIITLKGVKNFCELNQKDKSNEMLKITESSLINLKSNNVNNHDFVLMQLLMNERKSIDKF